MALVEPPAPGLINVLNNYVGGSFDALPEPSKRLLQHCKLSCLHEEDSGRMVTNVLNQFLNTQYGASDP